MRLARILSIAAVLGVAGALPPAVASAAPVLTDVSARSCVGGHGQTRPGHRAALDYMGEGQAFADHALGCSGVVYVIYRQRICFPGGGCQGMEDRGSPTQNHEDHVHVEY